MSKSKPATKQPQPTERKEAPATPDAALSEAMHIENPATPPQPAHETKGTPAKK